MAYPTIDTAHSAEALALLTDHYRTKINVPGLVKSFMGPIQELENVFWSIINSFLLTNTPTGDQLNKLGNIVGAERQPGMSDADYFQVVLLQIRVNRSQGLSEDIIQVATLYLQGQTPEPSYVDITQPINTSVPEQGAAFTLEIFNPKAPMVLDGLLKQVRSVGTYGTYHYTTWPIGTTTFQLASRYAVGGIGIGAGGYGSRYTSAVGGVLAAGSVI